MFCESYSIKVQLKIKKTFFFYFLEINTSCILLFLWLATIPTTPRTPKNGQKILFCDIGITTELVHTPHNGHGVNLISVWVHCKLLRSPVLSETSIFIQPNSAGIQNKFSRVIRRYTGSIRSIQIVFRAR